MWWCDANILSDGASREGGSCEEVSREGKGSARGYGEGSRGSYREGEEGSYREGDEDCDNYEARGAESRASAGLRDEGRGGAARLRDDGRDGKYGQDL